jgi:hypothetical protein
MQALHTHTGGRRPGRKPSQKRAGSAINAASMKRALPRQGSPRKPSVVRRKSRG